MRNLLRACCLLLGACARTPAADLAIRGVTVVDVTDGSLAPGQTVLVDLIEPVHQQQVSGVGCQVPGTTTRPGDPWHQTPGT